MSAAFTGLIGSPYSAFGLSWVLGAPAPVLGPATATLAGTPTTCVVGVESAAIVVTLDAAAPSGGTTVNLASDGSGDAFHATAGGSVVTSIAIVEGQTTGSALLVAGTAGARNVSITSAGLTVAGSPLAITASAASATAFTLAGPSSGYTANASANFTFAPNGTYTGTITPAMTGLAGSWSPSSLAWSSQAGGKTATFTPSAAGTGSANGTASPSLTQPSPVSYQSLARALAASPSSIPTSDTTSVAFTGTGTKWATTAPTFAASGVAGVSVGSVTVTSDTSATAPVTTGSAAGTVTYTDSTTSATATQSVAALPAGVSFSCFMDNVPDGITPTIVVKDMAGQVVTPTSGGVGVNQGVGADGRFAWSFPFVAPPGAYLGLITAGSVTRADLAVADLATSSAPTIDQIKAMIEQTVVGGLLVDGLLVTRGYAAQAIGATTITLAAGDPQFIVSNVGQTIRLLSGTGRGQTGIVTASNTSTGQQTIGAHWSDGVTPSGSVAYEFQPIASGGSGTDGLAASGAVEPGETGYQTLRLIRAFALGEMDLTSVSGHAIFRRKDGTEAFRIALPSNAGRPGGVNGGGL